MELRTIKKAPLCVYTRYVSCSARFSQSLRSSLLFRHDGTPPHYTNNHRQHLNFTFGKECIRRRGLVQWRARSPDLSCLDFFCWSQMNTLVYKIPIDSVEDVVACISVAAGKI
ncbi:hypothetical protein AVEN_131802-1 [Araneus ventricosus]|uniref:Uncharacterized protein n=1 Tax=Araneus ventricosus TaxID=182803 RepID=A0A4Y2KLL2_ARAVE|nr:hypothetical protein AVEN_131802-1 [Araneus ventricosus]